MKKITAIIALMLALSVATQAQVFIMEDDDNNRSSYSSESENIGIMPYHLVEHDQANFVPLGSGALLLAALGGAYLIGKRKKEA